MRFLSAGLKDGCCLDSFFLPFVGEPLKSSPQVRARRAVFRRAHIVNFKQFLPRPRVLEKPSSPTDPHPYLFSFVFLYMAHGSAPPMSSVSMSGPTGAPRWLVGVASERPRCKAIAGKAHISAGSSPSREFLLSRGRKGTGSGRLLCPSGSNSSGFSAI